MSLRRWGQLEPEKLSGITSLQHWMEDPGLPKSWDVS